VNPPKGRDATRKESTEEKEEGSREVKVVDDIAQRADSLTRQRGAFPAQRADWSWS